MTAPHDHAQTDRRSLPTMPSRRLLLPTAAVLALAALLLGALAAFADGGKRTAPALTSLATALPRPVPCPPREETAGPAAEPVPPGILDAFGVLRRERAADDELPAAALRALRDRGLEPFDPASARLLQRTADSGHAWVVPVRDVRIGMERFTCLPKRAPMTSMPATRSKTAHLPQAPPPAPVPPVRVIVPPTPPSPARTKPQPGLAVVALGGAPAGAGGTLPDLVRGRSEVAIDPCGGPEHDMLSVSGIVPDGVAAAFLTSPDGTAVRADVQDNAYAFVVPRTKAAGQRYVVWTGGDATPHVQPLPPTFFSAHMHCATPPKDLAVVSPSAGFGAGLCPHFIRRSLSQALRPLPLALPGPAPACLAAPVPSAPPRPVPRRGG
jgi:hypothetical protein